MASSSQAEEREIRFQFSWKVSRAEREKKQFDEGIWSPVFATANNGIRYLWALWLLPKGRKDEVFPSADEQPNVSLFLFLKKGSIMETVEAKYQFLMIKRGTRRWKGPIDTENFDYLIGNGLNELCLQTEIEKAEWVEFGARIWLKESAFDPDQLFPDPQFQNIHKNRRLYEQVVLRDRSQGRTKGDVTIIVSQRFRLTCHQLFLREVSPVFEAMFQQHWVEGQRKQIHIDDIPLKTLKQLLFFCYVDGMPEGWEENAVGLLRAAHKYDVAAVMLKCEKYLFKSLELGKAVEMLSLALELDLKLLEQQAMQLLVDNWGEEVQEEALEKLDPHAYLAVINGFAHQKNVTSL